MSFRAGFGLFGCSRGKPSRGARGALLLVLAALSAGCQKEDNHPPFAAGCETGCKPSPGISLGAGTSGTTITPANDAAINAGTLTGQVLAFSDDGFSRTVPFTKTAVVSADGAAVAAVSGPWDGADPYLLTGVAVSGANWVSVQPDDTQGDPQWTYHLIPTNAFDTVDLPLVSGLVLDQIFSSVIAVTTRSTTQGQVILIFHNSGTSTALAGLQASLAQAQMTAYSFNGAWTSDDTATTDNSGIVVFANVTAGPAQTVVVTRAATPTAVAAQAGRVDLKVVGGAVTVATVSVQL